MKYILSAAAASALMAGTAFAGNNSSPNWTGFYAGGELGYANVEIGTPFGSINSDGVIGGLIAGYDYDLGDLVIGAGIDYDWSDIELVPGVDVDSIWRAKLRGGYKVGNGLLYATTGYTEIEASVGGFTGSEDGYFVGVGYDYMASDNMSLGGEVLYHDYDVTGGSLEATTVQIRAAYRF
ncbi:outer membrane protein [Roseovarius sp. Pro17]|uniref:outer membrane protein n=1 Tax=Roseovarius sp. Pro17 TaxID=3108175 RepID=UPI002D785786|nr:outer membrane beta-barrel protein [Roseovarius sp. Pro17]